MREGMLYALQLCPVYYIRYWWEIDYAAAVQIRQSVSATGACQSVCIDIAQALASCTGCVTLTMHRPNHCMCLMMMGTHSEELACALVSAAGLKVWYSVMADMLPGSWTPVSRRALQVASNPSSNKKPHQGCCCISACTMASWQQLQLKRMRLRCCQCCQRSCASGNHLYLHTLHMKSCFLNAEASSINTSCKHRYASQWMPPCFRGSAGHDVCHFHVEGLQQVY